MKLSTASSYAVHALVNLAGRKEGALVPTRQIAQAEGVPEYYLLKILTLLARAQFLLSVKGPNGGYRLARPAHKIKLLEILEAVDGPLRAEVPPADGKADAGLRARLQTVYERVADQTRRQLGRVTVADLAK
jgi:Rrf2 family protein